MDITLPAPGTREFEMLRDVLEKWPITWRNGNVWHKMDFVYGRLSEWVKAPWGWAQLNCIPRKASDLTILGHLVAVADEREIDVWQSECGHDATMAPWGWTANGIAMHEQRLLVLIHALHAEIEEADHD